MGRPIGRRNMLGTAPGPWALDAACRDLSPEMADRLFFPEKGDHAVVTEARRICASCPVRAECLDFALVTNQTHGIWAGTSPRERRRIRCQRGLACCSAAAPCAQHARRFGT